MSSVQRNSRFNESRIRTIQGRQHGLVTRAQWQAAGFTPPALTRAVQRGELERVLPGVYRSTLIAPFLQQTALAAVLWAATDAVASHATAARLYGFDAPHDNPHIWVPPTRSPKSPLVVVHRGVVERNDRRVRDRVPLTSPARTLVDLAGVLDEESLEAVVEDFFHRGVTTPLAVQRCLDANGGTGRPGSRLLRDLLADRDQAPLELKLEQKIWRLLRAVGLRPVRQFDVRCAGQRYRLDFAWPILKVAVEGHGFAAHGGRLAHIRDNRRLGDLVSAGWRVVPVTWEDCTQDPGGMIEKVRGALLEAAA